MSNTITIISKVLPVILLIVLGNILHKFNFIKQETVAELKKIALNITLPLMLFLTFSETVFETKYFSIFIIIFIVCAGLLFIGLLIKKLTGSSNKYLPAAFTTFENGLLGYSLFVVVFGAGSLYKLAVLDLGNIIFFCVIYSSFFHFVNNKSIPTKKLLLSVLTTPLLLGVVAGILISSFGLTGAIKSIPLTNAVLETASMLSNLTVPIICITIGYELRINFRRILKPFLFVLLRLSILLVTAYLLNIFLIQDLLHLDRTFSIALYTMFLLPPVFATSVLLDDKAGDDKQLILNMISVNMILTIVLFPVMIILMK